MAKWLKKIETAHLAYLLLALVVTTSVFSMVGCTSEAPGIYQLFIAELRGSNVQFGYVGICSTVPGHNRVCKPALGIAPADLAKSLSLPIDVIQHVLALQRSKSFALPALSGILILLGVIAFLVACNSTGENSAKSRRRWMATTRIILWSSVGSAFAAAYLLTFSISAMEEEKKGIKDEKKENDKNKDRDAAAAFSTASESFAHLQTSNPFSPFYRSQENWPVFRSIMETKEGKLVKFCSDLQNSRDV
ncbi:hypothetical protein V493_01244 [Pseudogymnoascus sp. VKM F-4281 (FW-2241)]|nr:hypothetical protein V493_01244 [Pseudogymnoascus sp. VKM F-4281 (FW-2241)]